MSSPDPDPTAAEPLGCGVSGQFADWLGGQAGSIAVTTYQAGKVVLVGWDQGVTALFRHFERPMGLAVDGNRLALALNDQVCLFTNAPALAPLYSEEGTSDGYDAFYLPRVSFHTGPLDAHDLAIGTAGLWVVNTRFSCLAQLDADYSFVPRWTPPFITELIPEDRCHLNGLALVNGEPRYVTALAASNTLQGWREVKAHGGVLMDVTTNNTLLHTLSMPHSPRWYDGRLWFLNSGAGELCVADPGRLGYSVVAVLPGFLRGLCFVDHYALVGLSKLRPSGALAGLPIQNRFPRLTCGVMVVDLTDGRLVGGLEFTSGCTELYEVQWLPGCRRPMILNRDRLGQGPIFSTPQQGWKIDPPAEKNTAPAGP